MPVKPAINKRPCSLCHRVVEELRYHYDICEPCHQDFREPGEEHSEVEDSDSEDDVSIHSQEDDLQLPENAVYLEPEKYVRGNTNDSDDMDEKEGAKRN